MTDYKKNLDKFLDRVEDMNDLIELVWNLIFNIKDMTNDERIEKIWHAVNIYLDKYADYDEK